jgi:hypothetical protein
MGRITRPKMVVLPDSAIVSARNILDSPPSHFSHRVTKPQPYYFRKPRKATSPAGEFAAGDKLLLLSHDGGELCRVADANGLVVFTAFATLDPL